MSATSPRHFFQREFAADFQAELPAASVTLIASQKPTATDVANFQAWHKLGRFVKKGEKAF